MLWTQAAGAARRGVRWRRVRTCFGVSDASRGSPLPLYVTCSANSLGITSRARSHDRPGNSAGAADRSALTVTRPSPPHLTHSAAARVGRPGGGVGFETGSAAVF